MPRRVSRYSFRPVVHRDIPMLVLWLRTPEVMRWWGDPFAYAQNYDVHIWPQPHFASLPSGSHAIDAFVGEPEMIGRGHGGAFLKALALRLKRAGAPVVAIDPDVENMRARRAYEKAGFRLERLVETGDGSAALMVLEGAPRRRAL